MLDDATRRRFVQVSGSGAVFALAGWAGGDDEEGIVRRLADVDDGYDYPAVSDVIQVTVTPE